MKTMRLGDDLLLFGDSEFENFSAYLVTDGIIPKDKTLREVFRHQAEIKWWKSLWGWITFSTLVCALATSLGLSSFGGAIDPKYVFAPFVVCVIPAGIWLYFWSPAATYSDIVVRIRSELRQSHPKSDFLMAYDTASIDSHLGYLADEYLRDESTFRLYRSDPQYSHREVVQSGLKFQETVDNFAAAIDGLNKRFGKSFSKAELLRRAQLRADKAPRVITEKKDT